MSIGQSVRLSWREHDQAEHLSARQHAGPSAAPAAAADGFVTHQVSRRDTLAGIALKYNVPPADIKRFNGLLCDTDIYGRTNLLIPTKLLPVGDDIRELFAQVANRIGRDPVLNAEPAVHPPPRTSGTFTAMPLSMPGTGRVEEAPWWCRCGMCRAYDDPASTCRRSALYSSQAGDVELVERTPTQMSAGPGLTQDHVRRRHHNSAGGAHGTDRVDGDAVGSTSGLWDEGSSGQPSSHISPGWQTSGRPAGSTGPARAGGGTSAAAFLSSLGSALAESGTALVQKLRKSSYSSGRQGSAPPRPSDRFAGIHTSAQTQLMGRPAAASPAGGSEYVPLSSMPYKGSKDD